MLGQLLTSWWAIIALGVVAGTICGLLGVGSGIIMVPALVLALGFTQKSAQGMALAVMVPMAMVGAFRYWRNPDITMDPKIVLLIIAGALAGVLIGTELAARLPGHMLRKIFAAFLVLAASRMFFAKPKPKPNIDTGQASSQAVDLVQQGEDNNE
jgi:hypothetical protein